MPKIYLYAEVLTHIRQLTLHATVQSVKDESPQLDISSDKKIITVKHDGETSSLYLPTQISGTANVLFMTEKKTELSARVQIEDAQEWKNIEKAGNEAPWTASELTSETAIQCQECKAQILPSCQISVWKDLPSQDWADVMDLWYCHKPHEGHDTEEHKHAAEAKGTSATSKLASAQGTGMVDLVSLVLHPDDCREIKIAGRDNENDFKPRLVACSICNNVLGSFSSSDNLVRLYKSGLSVRKAQSDAFASYPASIFACVQLLSLIESTPLRKVVVHSSHSSRDGAAKTQPNREPDTKRVKKTATDTEPVETAPGGRRKQPSTNPPVAKSTSSSSQQTSSGTLEDLKVNSSSHPVSQEEAREVGKASIDKSHPVLLSTAPGGRRSQPLVTSVNINTDSSSTQGTPTKTVAEDSKSEPQIPAQAEFLTDPAPGSEDDKNAPAILLWIFNPDIYYSCSLHPSNSSSIATAHRAMKIFYQPLQDPTEYLSVHGQTAVEELHLPSQSDVESLGKALRDSNKMLPQSARTFQDWNVGLLDRYEKTATGEKVMEENPLARKPEGEYGDGRITRWSLPDGASELYL